MSSLAFQVDVSVDRKAVDEGGCAVGCSSHEKAARQGAGKLAVALFSGYRLVICLRHNQRTEEVLSHQWILEEINRELPSGVDWKDGAREYVKEAAKSLTNEGVFKYSMTKPMYELPTGEQAGRSLEEAARYLSNFLNVISLLKLPGGARFMDVACGAGWLSHYLRRFGYETFGFDIASDFIALAKQRVAGDPNLSFSPAQVDEMFLTHDIESDDLPASHHGQYDAIVLESCLHHFYDPISALRNLARCLKPTGVVLLIEGENRMGPIKSEYMDVMKQYRTIERPYPREQLGVILNEAGLPCSEFFGQLNGFFSPRDPVWGDATSRLRETERHMNLAVCAQTWVPINRVFPFLTQDSRSP